MNRVFARVHAKVSTAALALSLIFALAPILAWASQTIYVNGSPAPYTDPQNNVWGGGSDANPGTMAAPLATIGAASWSIREQGATVVIAPGTYSGPNNQVALPGYSGLTYKAADPQAKPVIDGIGSSSHGIWVGGMSSGATIKNLKIQNVAAWGRVGVAITTDHVTLDGVEVSGSAYRTLDLSGATNFLVENCKFLSPNPGAPGHVVLSGPASGTISECVIDADNNATYAVNNASYGAVTISNSIITGGGAVGITQNSNRANLTLDSITCLANCTRSCGRYAIENLNRYGMLRVYESIINSGSAVDPVNQTLYQPTVDSGNHKNVDPHFRSYKVGTGVVTISFDDNGNLDLWNAYAAAAAARNVHLTFFIQERTWKDRGRDDNNLIAWKNAGHDVATHTYSHTDYDAVGEPAISIAYFGHGHEATARIENGHLITEVDDHEDLNIALTDYVGYEKLPAKHVIDLVAKINQDHDYHAVFNPLNLTSITNYLKATSLADMPPTDMDHDGAYLTIDANRFYRDEILDVDNWLEAAIGGGYSVVSIAPPANVWTPEAKAFMMDSTGIQVCRGDQYNSQDNILLRSFDLYDLYSVYSLPLVGDRSEDTIKQAARAIATAAIEQGGVFCVFGHSTEFTSAEQLGWFIDALQEFVPKGLKILSLREFSDYVRDPGNGWTYQGDGRFTRTFADNSDYGIEAGSPVDSFPPVDYVTHRSTSGAIIPEARTDAFVPGEVIGRFAPGAIVIPDSMTSGTVFDIQDNDLRRVADSFDMTSVKRLYRSATADTPEVVSRTGELVKLSNAWDVYLLRFIGESDSWEIADSLRHLPCCVYAEPNALLAPCLVPSDSLYGSQWNLARIDMSNAWDIETGSTSVRIGILDTGIDYGNPSFGGTCGPGAKVEGGWNYLDNDSLYVDDASGLYDSHGTLVAGVVGAFTNNGDAIAGIAGGWGPDNPGCRLYALKVADQQGAFRLDAVCNAVREAWPVYRVDILNASFGGYGYYESLREAVSDAHKMGVVFTAAKGNDGRSDFHFPSDLDCDWVISVGASNDKQDNPPAQYERRVSSADGYAWTSNWGNGIDVLAPGTAIESSARTSSPSPYRLADGTSLAAAHVAGLAGLMLSAKYDLSSDDVEGFISVASKDISVDAQGGTGLGGYDQWSGYGRIVADSTLVFLTWPYSYEHCTAGGGHTVNTTSYIDLAFAGDGPLSGRYFGKRYDVRCSAPYPAGFTGFPHAWARGLGASTGWSAATPNYQVGFARLVEGSETQTGCELQSYVYEVWTTQGDYLGWYPCRPEQVVFGYTVLGQLSALAGVTPDARTLAGSPRLYPPSENPCRDHTVIAFDLPRAQDASLRIYDIRGREVCSLFGGRAESGKHQLTWNGRDADGHRLAPGMYFCRLETGQARLTTRIVLIR